MKFSHEKTSKNIYAGIGSGEIPDNVRYLMREIGVWMARAGWTLRSGGAPSADVAFEMGCDVMGGTKEIFLPRDGYHRELGAVPPRYCNPTNEARLSLELNDSVKRVICWTIDGSATGGTGPAHCPQAEDYNSESVLRRDIR